MPTRATHSQPKGAEVARLESDIMAAAFKGLPMGKREANPNGASLEVCPFFNSHLGCVAHGGAKRPESECSRAHAEKPPKEFSHAALALQATKGGHKQLPRFMGQAAQQMLVQGYSLAYRADSDGKQLSSRDAAVAVGNAARHRSLGQVLGDGDSAAKFMQADLERDTLQADLEHDYYQFGYEWDPPPSTEAVIGDVSDESASTLQASTSCRPGGSYDVDLPPQSL